jgi:hypothetical protein
MKTGKFASTYLDGCGDNWITGDTENGFLTPGDTGVTRTSTLRPNTFKLVGFEVLTAVVMKSTIFWDITPCSPLRVN